MGLDQVVMHEKIRFEQFMTLLGDTTVALNNTIIKHTVAVNIFNCLMIVNHLQAVGLMNLTNVKKCTKGYDSRTTNFMKYTSSKTTLLVLLHRHVDRIQEDSLSGSGFRNAHKGPFATTIRNRIDTRRISASTGILQ